MVNCRLYSPVFICVLLAAGSRLPGQIQDPAKILPGETVFLAVGDDVGKLVSRVPEIKQLLFEVEDRDARESRKRDAGRTDGESFVDEFALDEKLFDALLTKVSASPDVEEGHVEPSWQALLPGRCFFAVLDYQRPTNARIRNRM